MLRAPFLALVFVLSTPALDAQPGSGQLLLLDWTSNNGAAALAIDCLGLTSFTTVVTSGPDLEAALSTGSYSTVVVDDPSNILEVSAQSALVDHVAAGGGLVISYWGMATAIPELHEVLGIESAVDYTIVQGFSSGACCTGDPVWTTPNALPGEAVEQGLADGWFVDGQELIANTGTPRGEFANGAIAALSDNGGATFVIAATLDSLDIQNARDFTANAILESLTAVTGGIGAVPCPLLNDSCFAARSVTPGATLFSSEGAVDEGTAPSCASGTHNDIWFSYTPICTGEHTISTCGSSFDTTLAIYDACLGAELACGDNECGLSSSLTLSLSAGVSYLVQVGGVAGASGSGTLTVDTSGTAPSNDLCSDATPLLDGVPVAFSTVCATADGVGGSCGSPTPTSPDVWFSFTASIDSTVVFDTCAATYDTVLEAYSECPATGVLLACNDDSCNLQSQISVFMLAGESITIRATGFAGATGIGEINATVVAPLDTSNYDVVVINGEGELGGGLVISSVAFADALTNAGVTFIEVEPNLGQLFTGCPNLGWIYNNGTFPDCAAMDPSVMSHLTECVFLGNGAIASGAEIWGFAAPTAFYDIDGIGPVGVSAVQIVDVAGVAGSVLEGLASSYTADQVFADWNDVLGLATPGTDLLGDDMTIVLDSPTSATMGLDYNVGVFHPNDEAVAPGAGNTFSMSIEPAGLDAPLPFLATVLELTFNDGFDPTITFVRGDCNNEGAIDISDPVFALEALFVSGATEPSCPDACDANDDGGFDIADPVMLLASLFIGGPPLAPPTFPACGLDPTLDMLACPTPQAACP